MCCGMEVCMKMMKLLWIISIFLQCYEDKTTLNALIIRWNGLLFNVLINIFVLLTICIGTIMYISVYHYVKHIWKSWSCFTTFELERKNQIPVPISFPIVQIKWFSYLYTNGYTQISYKAHFVGNVKAQNYMFFTSDMTRITFLFLS